MRETLERIAERYRTGGVLNVIRGIRDYTLYHTEIPIHKAMRNKDLTIGDTTVTIRTDRTEGYHRATDTNEIEPLKDFERRIGENDTVWDIGSNIGLYSLFAAANGAGVISFDPGIIPQADAIRNAQENNLTERIDHVPVALSDRNGIDLLSHSDKHGTRRIGTETGDIVVSLQGDGLDVPNPSVLKIDVEGHEYSVLQGLQERLETVETVYVEIHGQPYIEILSLLWGNGFSATEVWNIRETGKMVRFD